MMDKAIHGLGAYSYHFVDTLFISRHTTCCTPLPLCSRSPSPLPRSNSNHTHRSPSSLHTTLSTVPSPHSLLGPHIRPGDPRSANHPKLIPTYTPIAARPHPIPLSQHRAAAVQAHLRRRSPNPPAPQPAILLPPHIEPSKCTAPGSRAMRSKALVVIHRAFLFVCRLSIGWGVWCRGEKRPPGARDTFSPRWTAEKEGIWRGISGGLGFGEDVGVWGGYTRGPCGW